MSNRDRFAASTIVVALVVLVGAMASSVTSAWNGRESVRHRVAQHELQVHECNPDAQDYFTCADLVAQEGMRRATDRLTVQGDSQFALGLTNLILLIATLAASIVATLISARAVRVAREEMENSLQPRLTIRFPEKLNWDPTTKAKPADPLAAVTGGDAEPYTSFVFHNFGRGPAIINIVWARHFWRNDYPSEVTHLAARNYNWLPHGVIVKESGGDSEPFEAFPLSDIAKDPEPTGKDKFWFLQGYVIYEGLAGAKYMTTFCYYYDVDKREFALGPDGALGMRYNRTDKFNRRLFGRLELTHMVAGQQ